MIAGLFFFGWQYWLSQRLSRLPISYGGDLSYWVRCPLGTSCRSLNLGPLARGECRPWLDFILKDLKLFLKEKPGSNSFLPNSPKEVVVRGEIVCLPKISKNYAPQTLECALGLKGEDGRFYGLRNLRMDEEGSAWEIGSRVEITGKLIYGKTKGPDGNKYDIIGTIEIFSIRKR